MFFSRGSAFWGFRSLSFEIILLDDSSHSGINHWLGMVRLLFVFCQLSGLFSPKSHVWEVHEPQAVWREPLVWDVYVALLTATDWAQKSLWFHVWWRWRHAIDGSKQNLKKTTPKYTHAHAHTHTKPQQNKKPHIIIYLKTLERWKGNYLTVKKLRMKHDLRSHSDL